MLDIDFHGCLNSTMEATPNSHDQIAYNLHPSTLEAVAEFQATLDTVFEGEERQQLDDAVWLMCELHGDQNARPDGTPYPEHPLDVARNVLTVSQELDSRKIVAALLHDSVEDQADKLAAKAAEIGIVGGDTKTRALDYLAARFGDQAAYIVFALTNPDFAAVLSAQGLPVTADGKNRLYAEHVHLVIQDSDVLPIKLFDFAANALRLDEVTDPARRLKLTRKYAPVVDIFIDRLTNGMPTGLEEWRRLQFTERLTEACASMDEWLQSHDDIAAR